MGEISEAMLEGFLCEQCGDIIGDVKTGEGQGFPGLCAGCHRDSGLKVPLPLHKRKNQNAGINQTKKRFRCSTCHKGFRSAFSLEQHSRDSHGTSAIRFTRTGRTIAFNHVNIGAVFFAHDNFFIRMNHSTGLPLFGTSNDMPFPREFLLTFREKLPEFETVEVVDVEGNNR